MDFLEVSYEEEGTRLTLYGDWRLLQLEELNSYLGSRELLDVLTRIRGSVILDGSKLESLDTAGALFLLDTLEQQVDSDEIKSESFNTSHASIIKLVSERKPAREIKRYKSENIIAHVGRETLALWRNIVSSISFLGRFVYDLLPLVIKPFEIRWRELFVQLELACVKSLPVIALVNFLIGTVVAYIFADQVRRYGANIFIVDGVAVAMSRELAPLIVAIVMAGRSGSSFTAQIGSMKINEEIDAIQALGLSVMNILVIPRVIALAIALPLLGILATGIGIGGGMIVAQVELGITPTTFLERMHDNVAFRHFWIGLIKAPVFAIFIALIGCRMGLAVENNTRSVGLNTTSTVVQSIVVVILVDALFAVIFMKLGL